MTSDMTNAQNDGLVKPPMTPPTQAHVNAAPGAPVQPGGVPAAPSTSTFAPTAPTPVQVPTAPAALQPSQAPQTPALGPASPTPTGVALSGITPGPADLRTQNVLPDAGVDRYKLAQDRQATYLNQQEPITRSASRSIYQDAASRGMAGPGGAGELRTNLGNLGLQEDREARNNLSSLLSNATEGTIQDAANNRNEFRQERAYNNGLENQAYDRGIQGLTLEDQLTNSQFGRGLATSQFGASGNPGATQLGLSGMYGQQASDAGNSLAQLLQGNAQNNILSSIYGQSKPQGGGSQTPAYSPNNNLMSSIYGDA